MTYKITVLTLSAIAIIERDTVMGDVTTMKIEAIQLGYMCCVQLKNSQKQGEFEKQLSELKILIPDLEQTKIKVKHFSVMCIEVTLQCPLISCCV